MTDIGFKKFSKCIVIYLFKFLDSWRQPLQSL